MNILGYEIEEMSKKAIAQKVATDPKFALLFFVANNPAVMAEEANAEGFDGVSPVDDPSELTEWLFSMLNRQPKKVARIIAKVPYDPDASNWTGEIPKPKGVKKANLSSMLEETER